MGSAKGNAKRLSVIRKTAVLVMTMAVLLSASGCDFLMNTYPKEKQSADNYRIKILQFNIQTENGNPAPFETRSEMYRELMDELMPDVVGMQEVTVTWRKWLDDKVFNRSYASVGQPRTEGGEANPIYYRKDKFGVAEYGTFWLSDSPDVPGSSFDDANYPRICTWIVLQDKVTGIDFVFMNTHLDHNGKNDSSVGGSIRKRQMSVIVKFAERFGDMPVFLTGDLNARMTTGSGGISGVYKLVTGLEEVTDDEGNAYRLDLADSRLNAPVTVDENHTATMTKYYDESSASYEPSREPIDYVFYRPGVIEPLTYETFLISKDGYEISDHLPVFTTFRLKKEAG
ncbi:MAG: endonuclease/exonuclease/phosphatase family protein [Clostridia bacterium]|nr:endonuclease/exonuclease/phosphatase family protein [Clostridia bacterium]